jgi:hypothetical protein
MRTRTLTLKKETLTELTTAELGSVVGGQLSGPSCNIACNQSDFQQCLTGLHCINTLDSCITGTTNPTQ